MDIAQVEEEILKAIECVKKEGWTIVRHTTIDNYYKQCCPLSAYAICHGLKYDSLWAPLATIRALGFQDSEEWQFIDGFDGTSVEYKDSDLNALGKKLNNQLIKGVQA